MQFISHGHPSSLKESFEVKLGPLDFNMVSELGYSLQLLIIHNCLKCCSTNPVYHWLCFLLSSQLYNFSSPHKCYSLKLGIPFFKHLLSSQSPSDIFSQKPVPLYFKLKLPPPCLSLRGRGGGVLDIIISH